jgi:hypothetical protein
VLWKKPWLIPGHYLEGDMKKIICFMFIIFSLQSQELKITVFKFDNTEDYWNHYYQQLGKDTDALSKRNFEIINRVKVWYYCPGSNYFRHYRLIEIDEIDNNSFSYGEWRGLNFFGDYYFLPTLDYYKLKSTSSYDFIEKTYKNIELYHTDYDADGDGKCDINKMGVITVRIKTRIREFKGEIRKYIDFYGIYNKYMERYTFTIIFKEECL